MNALIGDIGNTTTKICLIGIKNFKVKKIIYFNSNNITSKKFLRKELKKIIKNKFINKNALFSSVVLSNSSAPPSVPSRTLFPELKLSNDSLTRSTF